MYQAELYAILKALMWLQENRNIKEAGVRSDSSSSINAIVKFTQKNELVQQIQQVLNTLTKHGKSISIRWVRAHVGTLGNERADSLAKQATKRPTEIPLKFPKSYIYRLLRSELQESWRQLWTTHKTGRHLHEFLRTVNDNRLFGNPAINALLTNHGPFMEYLHRFKAGDVVNPLCICGANGNAKHYMFSCPLTKVLHFRTPAMSAAQKWAETLNSTPSLITKANNLIALLLSKQEELKHP